MSDLVVDLGALEAFVGQLERFAARLARVQADVDAQVAQLPLTWTGAASAAQQAAHRRWACGASDAHAAVVALRSVAATAHANYLAAVGANRRMWVL